jgi:translation initiation factor IF-1
MTRYVPSWATGTARAFCDSREEERVSKQDAIELEGTVSEVLPNATFRVVTPGGHDVLSTLGGKLRQHRIRILAGDAVRIEVSPYDLTRGRITFRFNTGRTQSSG